MILKRILKGKSLAYFTGFALTFVVCLWQWIEGNALADLRKRVDGIFYDMRLNATLIPRPETEYQVIVVDIDEKSLEAEGRWPWSRAKVATMIENMANAGAVVIAFDVINTEVERNPVTEILNSLDNLSDQAKSELAGNIDQMDADQKMADMLQETDVTLGFLFTAEEIKRGTLPNTVVKPDVDDIENLEAEKYPSYVSNIAKLQDAAPGIGFINSSPDADGFIRRTSMVIKHGDKLYPSLALEAARLYALGDDIPVFTAQEGAKRSITGLTVGKTRVNTDSKGKILIPFRGPQKSFPYISASDVYRNNISEDQFDSSVVFVGTSAVGHADLRSTPVGLQYPGVEIHANAFEGIMDPSLLHYQPDWATAAVIIYLVLVGFVLSIVLPNLGPFKMVIVGAIAIVFTIWGNFYLWTDLSLALPPFTSILLILAVTFYNFTQGFFAESNQKKMIKGIFNQYVPPAHIDRMIQNPDDVSLDGERKEMSVLFSDIRSFTTISEKLTAAELKQLLNRYFNPITKSIFDHHGTIDKYVGDMVMAFWGAPLDDEQHANNSIETAFDMLDITHKLAEEFVAEGWPEIKIGVGINTGDMNVGDMGSEYRRAYTVLGDSVNLGSRLEGLTKFYGVELLVSEFTKSKADKYQFRLIDKVKVKGKDEAVTIYEPIRMEDYATQKDELGEYHRAHDIYLKQDWDAAEQAFKTLEQKSPRKIYPLYLERIAHLRELPKQENWDGSFTHTSK